MMMQLATRCVLVVDDNPGDVRLIREAASVFSCLALFDVPNVVQAHLFLRQRPPFEGVPVPDLVLLDLHMPIFDGSSVLQTMRGNPALHGIPVVVLTSSRLERDRDRCLDLGATAFHCKPADWPSWQQEIRSVLRTYLRILPEDDEDHRPPPDEGRPPRRMD
jgi:CheY-like chemotaxis protein